MNQSQMANRLGVWSGIVANVVAIVTLYQAGASWPIWAAIVPALAFSAFGGFCLRDYRIISNRGGGAAAPSAPLVAVRL